MSAHPVIAHPARTPVLLAGAVVTAAVVVDPNTTHVPLCPFHAITGWYCPLCGGLRAIHALSRGQWTAAWHANMLLVVALALLPVALLVTRSAHLTERRRTAVIVTLVVVAFAFTVLRNLPFATALRPVG